MNKHEIIFNKELQNLEGCTDLVKEQINDLERKLYASIQITSQDMYKVQKELMEFKKAFNVLLRYSAAGFMGTLACIVVIFIKVFYL
jgi:hypothetical protein